ncbi:hypothetical protein CCMA1212_005463 [Trichoderma ghanense]|uniref:Uncharacterized protein n=1 Tax=Trichoderma ghanense TaxID=65468 RepID=A0ABY2H378_9HYPO
MYQYRRSCSVPPPAKVPFRILMVPSGILYLCFFPRPTSGGRQLCPPFLAYRRYLGAICAPEQALLVLVMLFNCPVDCFQVLASRANDAENPTLVPAEHPFSSKCIRMQSRFTTHAPSITIRSLFFNRDASKRRSITGADAFTVTVAAAILVGG